MVEQRIYKLSEITSRLSSGRGISPDNIHSSGQFPVIGGNGERGFTETHNFDGECAIIGRQGAYCGNVRYFKGKAYMTEHAVIAVVNSSHNMQYVAYYLAKMNLGLLSGQAAQPGISVQVLKRQKMLLPNLETQNKIASIISTYDTLIETNNKRIKLLEEMGENLYKEWFVRFRFPGYEDAEFENGIPKEWSYCKTKDIFTVCYGKDHKKIEDGEIPILGSGGIMRYGNKSLYTGKSILIPRKGSLNNVMYMNESFWTVDTMFYTIPLVEHSAEYIYYTMSKIDLEGLNSGAALPSMTTDIIYHLKIRMPDKKTLEMFEKAIEPLFMMIKSLKEQSENLTKQRDLLLPRLMSGKLEV